MIDAICLPNGQAAGLHMGINNWQEALKTARWSELLPRAYQFC
jgi:hypothetical protein